MSASMSAPDAYGAVFRAGDDVVCAQRDVEHATDVPHEPPGLCPGDH